MKNKRYWYKDPFIVAGTLATVVFVLLGWMFLTAPTEEEERFVDYMYSNGFGYIEQGELIEMGQMTCETLEVTQVEQMLEALVVRGNYTVEDSVILIVGSATLLCPEYQYKLQQYIDYGEVY